MASGRASTWLGASALSMGLTASLLVGAAPANADRGEASDGTRHGSRTSSAETSAAPDSGTRSSRTGAPGRGGSAAASPVAGTARAAEPIPIGEAPGAPVASVAAAVPVTTPPAQNPASVVKPAPDGAAVGRQPGPIVSFFISDGTRSHPDAGLLIGNGFTFTTVSCPASTRCDGGRAGYLYGNGGNGFNGGDGGGAGMFGNGGNGGGGTPSVRGGSGGNGGSVWFVGNGGSGGAADRNTAGARGGRGGSAGLFLGNGGDGGNAAIGANGGDGGKGGLLLGRGGRGGVGGPGAMTCSAPTCTVVTVGGSGGDGGRGGLLFGRNGGAGAAPLPLDSQLLVGYNPVYPVYAPVPPYQPDENEIGSNGGGLIYPNDDDPSKPYAIPGTIVPDVQLPAGFTLARWGYPGGSYLTPANTFLAQTSLPPSGLVAPYFQYVVADPSALPPGFHVEQSQAAPWFGQPGGGVQYRIIGPNGKGAPVQALLDSGFLAYP